MNDFLSKHPVLSIIALDMVCCTVVRIVDMITSPNDNKKTTNTKDESKKKSNEEKAPKKKPAKSNKA